MAAEDFGSEICCHRHLIEGLKPAVRVEIKITFCRFYFFSRNRRIFKLLAKCLQQIIFMKCALNVNKMCLLSSAGVDGGILVPL